MAAKGAWGCQGMGSQWTLPVPSGSFGAWFPGSWLGPILIKRPPEAGSCLAEGHGQCDWAAELVTKVRRGQRMWASGLGLWEV